jgi:hypothetical protein
MAGYSSVVGVRGNWTRRSREVYKANIARRRRGASEAPSEKTRGDQEGDSWALIRVQMVRNAIGTLQLWEHLTAIIALTFMIIINELERMSADRKSSIPVFKRSVSSPASEIVTSVMLSGQQSTLHTPSLNGGDVLSLPMQMPQAGTPGAPLFSGNNVSDFLIEFDSVCDDARLPDAARASRLPRYCYPEVGRYIKSLPEWEEGDWISLKKVMHKEWEGEDDFQHTRTLAFLEALKNKDREGIPIIELRQYCRQFKQSASHLKKKGQLNDYQASSWFLQGLPRFMANKVVRDKNLDPEKPEDMRFDDIYLHVLEQCDITTKFHRIYKPDNTEAIEALVARVPARPVVVDPSSAEVWRPETLHIPPPPPRDHNVRKIEEKLTHQRGDDYETTLLDKMSKLSIRNIRAELARERQFAANTQAFPSPGPGNSGAAQPAEPGYMRGPPRFNDVAGDRNCYFCGQGGHFKPNCEVLRQMERDGKIYRNADYKLCVGPEEENGSELRFQWGRGTQAEQAEQQYRGYVRYMQSRGAPDTSVNAKTHSVKLIMIGARPDYKDIENDTEGEGDSDYDPIGVAAARAMTRSQRKDTEPLSQGPVLDQARRVVKMRQEKEARLPAPKNTRFGRYKPATMEDAEDDGGAAMVVDTDNITEEIPGHSPISPAEYSASDPPQGVGPANTGAPYGIEETEKKASNGRKLVTALNQDKVTGARQLVKSMMDSKVEVTIGSLLAGSGEARKLLFSVKE